MKLKDISNIQKSAQANSRRDFSRLGFALLFMLTVFIYATTQAENLALNVSYSQALLVIAALIGAYMAMNIGANDVANNMGPAVGSKALTMAGAILIAATFEMLGAIIAGGEVVTTVKNGIISPEMIADAEVFILVMTSALLAGAVWLNLATVLGAPVSTTHSIVGAVMGAGIAAGGFAVVNFEKMGAIVGSWIISPLMGGVIAAGLLYTIKRTITYREKMTDAAAAVVPCLNALMAWAFATYMLIKGLGSLYKLSFGSAAIVGLAVAAIIYFWSRSVALARASRAEHTKDGVNSLFGAPLIFAAALLSFAHGANDVANAIGPLAAVYDALLNAAVTTKATIPMWIMLIGALGLAVGLALYGPKLIKTVGSEITDLDKMRAYCIALSAALTVIIASQLGLPVSTTHVAIGAVFGVGFLREYLKSAHAEMVELIIVAHEGEARSRAEQYIEKFRAAPLKKKALMLAEMKQKAAERKAKNAKKSAIREADDPHFTKKERKALKKVYKKELVKRSALAKIVAAWIITVPATAILSATFFLITKMFF
ncbi:MAG: inorganic phosphate transporter [Helicobacteraceae bacterium]|nr:inorganic phosphate transporter [Helicobacteraceae bacterium]